MIYDDKTFKKILRTCEALTHLHLSGSSFQTSCGYQNLAAAEIKSKIQEIDITNCTGISDKTLNI